ncbi:MAG: UbiD family decarboxylase [Actinomycetes bacterium]
MPQQSLSDFVADLESTGQLVRIKDQVSVDQLPSIMEANPDTAVLVENVKDCGFQFLANAYSNRTQYAQALGCDAQHLGQRIAELGSVQHPPQEVKSAPCKDVIVTGDDVDLTALPLFLHHEHDGHAYIQDTSVVSRDPDTGLINWGIYRFMFRTPNELNVDMRNDTHTARIHAKKYLARGEDMPIAVVIGGPALDKIAAMYSVAGVDDWDVLGGFYGEPAQVVKCETNDLTVPATAEIVLEGRVITTEGWVYDEGPYGEFTGTYGGGLPHNCRVVIDAITYRKNGIYQHATIGGMHPGRTDMAVWNATIESDLMAAISKAGVDVREVFIPEGGGTNIAYAQINPVGGGDAKQTLALMLTASRQWLPKIAYVFDTDVDIFDPDRVAWAMAWRFDPSKDIMVLPEQNILPLDPMGQKDAPPLNFPKVGFDCTIPIVGNYDKLSFAACHVTQPLPDPGTVTELSHDQLVKAMTDYIKAAPRSWKDIIEQFNGQPYPAVYRAFGALRPKLGRVVADRPAYPYTFSDTCFVTGSDAESK